MMCWVTVWSKEVLATGDYTVIIMFIPHCHGNGLIIGGVYLRYMRDYLMDSRIYAQKVNWLLDRHGQ